MKLNRNRLRATRGYRTAESVAETLPPWYNKVERGPFYEKTSIALEKAVFTQEDDCARPLQREIIFNTLEKCGLIERKRGSR